MTARPRWVNSTPPGAKVGNYYLVGAGFSGWDLLPGPLGSTAKYVLEAEKAKILKQVKEEAAKGAKEAVGPVARKEAAQGARTAVTPMVIGIGAIAGLALIFAIKK